ncbi:MAG: right-handed parallel beta-helix repeat-containing protein [Acidobacteria bacterium]|nr:right-handed parallel beta-helix repeat-containing protein [Acidobacteriota bacterium]MBV9478610.1 right-handed parallel beta-helix repeat-containing protein [Acidobacteriota bacterium]
MVTAFRFARVTALLAVTFLSRRVLAATYYVAPTGSDSAGLGTLERPLATITAAAARAVAGDTVSVRGGRYREAVRVHDKHGTAQTPIVVRAYPGERPILDDRDVTNAQAAAITLDGSSFVELRGLEVAGSSFIGINVWSSQDILVDGNIVRDCRRAGIYGGAPKPGISARLTFRDNTVTNCVLENEPRAMRVGWAQSVSTQYTDGATIVGNRIFRNYGEGIALIVSSHGLVQGNQLHDNYSVEIYLDNARHSRVDRNFISATSDEKFYRGGLPATGIACANETYEYMTPLTDLTITNNIVAWARWGFYYGNYDQGGGLQNVTVAHNTFYHSHEESIRVTPASASDPNVHHSGSVIADNIFDGFAGRPLAQVSGTGVSYHHNHWNGGTAAGVWLAASPTDTHGDPKFADPEGNRGAASFELQQGSPCIDRAAPMPGIATDYFGRPRHGAPDMGALEH